MFHIRNIANTDVKQMNIHEIDEINKQNDECSESSHEDADAAGILTLGRLSKRLTTSDA